MKVIRVIQYEGDEASVRTAIRQSKQLGVHEYSGYTITIAEHLNELPPLLPLEDSGITQLIKTQQLISLIES